MAQLTIYMPTRIMCPPTPDRMCVHLPLIIQASYGRHDDASVATVKALYKDLDLEEVFKNYEQVRVCVCVVLCG